MIDKNGVLKFVNELEKAEGAVELTQQKIINKMVEEMTDIPHESRITVIDETMKMIDRKERPTAYQYASRMKAIIGAVFLVPKFKMVGGVNAVYKQATDALKEAGIDPKGRKVEQVRAERATSKREALEKEITYKLQSNLKDKKMSMDEFRAHVEQEVNKVMADDVLSKVQKNVETFGKRMLEQQGLEYAEEFAKALLSYVREQAKEKQKAAA